MKVEIELEELVKLVSKTSASKMTEIGKNYLIRTVTMNYTGKVIEEYDDHFVLKQAAWVAETGRFADVLVSCDFDEVEPYPPEKRVVVSKEGVSDLVDIETLPLKQK